MGVCFCKSAAVSDNSQPEETKENLNEFEIPKQYNNALRLILDEDIGGFLGAADINTVEFKGSLESLEVDPKEKSMDQIIEEFSQLDGAKQYDLITKVAEQIYGESLAKQADIIKKRVNAIDNKELEIKNDSDIDDMEEKKIDNNDITITEHIVNELKKAIANKVTAKAAGADRAFTRIVDPLEDGSLLKLSKLGYRNPNCNDLIAKNLALLTEDAQNKIDSKNIALIEAGCYVRDIENYYWTPDNPNADPDPKKEYFSLHRSSLYDENGQIYHCLPNRGGFEYLSYVGLSSVGAMGFSATNYDNKGANIGDIASAILSLRLLTVQNGTVNHYQIEPTNGIHNSDAADALKAQTPSVTLIQNDQIFSDVVTSMGTYGIITHCYIELADAYWLTMKRQHVEFTVDNQQPWIDLYNSVANDPAVWQFEAWFQPYDDKILGKKQKCAMLITSFRKPAAGFDPKSFKPNTREEIEKHGGANRNVKDYPISKILLASVATQMISNTIEKFKLKGVGSLTAALNVALNQVKISQNTDPNTGKKVDTLTMSCVEALDFGSANLVPTNTSGNSFNISESINASRDYIIFLNQQAEKNHLTVTSPIALRFSKQSYGSVACAGGEYDTAWIEQPILTVGKDDVLTKGGYKRAYDNSVKLFTNSLEWFLSEYKGKIHWGEWFDQTNENGHEKWWGNISKENKDSFMSNYKKFNSDKIFSNRFTTNSGMDSFLII